MGAIFTSFIVPQAIALTNNPGSAVSQEALERVLFVSCLCISMCWVGYQIDPNVWLLKKLEIQLNEKKLFQAGIVLAIISSIASILVARTAPKLEGNTQWTGIITIYYFFYNVIYPAFTILLLVTLRKPSFARITLTVCAIIPGILAVFSAGRRTPMGILLFTIVLALFYERRYVPPRWIIIVLIFFTMIILPLMGLYRGELWAHIFSGNIANIDFMEGINRVLEGQVLELRNAAVFMDAAERTGRYGYGTGYWDEIVFLYIPGQLIGYSLKQSLQFNLSQYDVIGLYGYRLQVGLTTTGIGDSFIEFSYFGCLIFGLIGYFYKHIWLLAAYRNCIFSQILYAGLLAPSILGVTHGTYRFLQDALFQLIFIGVAAYYSKEKPKNSKQLIRIKQYES
jgi:oligosaccharide repeat unit polymerase